MVRGTIAMFVIYHRPADFPGRYVVRRWNVSRERGPQPEPEPLAVTESLDEARDAVPDGLKRLDRHPTDIRSIVEVWV